MLYSRLFTLASQKAHNSTQFALNNLTNIPTPYKCMREHIGYQIHIGQYFRPQV